MSNYLRYVPLSPHLDILQNTNFPVFSLLQALKAHALSSPLGCHAAMSMHVGTCRAACSALVLCPVDIAPLLSCCRPTPSPSQRNGPLASSHVPWTKSPSPGLQNVAALSLVALGRV